MPLSLIKYNDIFHKLHEKAILPAYQHEDDSGLDVYAYIEDGHVVIPPRKSIIISTGVTVTLPPCTELQLRSRSGLAAKHNVIVMNSPATVDEGYRYYDESDTAEIKIILFNLGVNDFVVQSGDRVAQAVLADVMRVKMPEGYVYKERKGKGIGSTGI